MELITIRNVNPLGQVDLPIAYRQGDPLGEHGTGCLEPGEEFQVPADVAGRPPAGTPGEDDYDPGEGLLAQADNYEHVAGELIEPDKVPGGAIGAVIKWVGTDAVKATAAIEAENHRRPSPRSSLLEQLNAIVEGDQS